LIADSSFSTELSDLHKQIERLKAQRDKLEARLREEMAAPTLSLGQNVRGAFVVNVKRKTEIGKLDRSPDFYVMSETRASKTFANNVSGRAS
jgi:DNA mismatch repair ATPase MutS